MTGPGIPLFRAASHADPLRVAVLVSGRGSNMEAIAKSAFRGDIPVQVVRVIADRPEAGAIRRAQDLGLEVEVIDRRALGRERYHAELAGAIEACRAELVALAGYMRILPVELVRRFERRIVNIHPSLLPSFPGLEPHRQALEHGVKVSGCTVHLVDEGVDTGPIILQKAVPVLDDDTPESLAARVLEVEHVAYPEALGLAASGKLVLAGRKVVRQG